MSINNVWIDGMESECNVPKNNEKKSLYILVKISRKVGALFSSRIKSFNFVSLRLNSEVFKAAQSYFKSQSD